MTSFAGLVAVVPLLGLGIAAVTPATNALIADLVAARRLGTGMGVFGTILGTGSGFVTSFLIGKYHLIHLPADMFMVSNVPVELNPWNFVLVAVATIVLCMLASVYPALQAARLRPVEVIRYE